MYTVKVFCLVGMLGTVEAPRVDELLSAWEHGCQLLHSYDLYIRAHQEVFLDPRNDWKARAIPISSGSVSRQVRADDKRRIESQVEKPGDASPAVVVWNGTLVKAYNLPAKQLVIEAELVHTTPNLIGQSDYECLYRNAVGNVALCDIIRDRPEKTVEGQDESTFILYSPPVSGKYEFSPFGFRVWLDSQKNFMPVRIQHVLSVSGEEIVYVQCDNTLEEVRPGVWAVVSSRVLNFPPRRPSEVPPEKAQETVVIVDPILSRFNSTIPESTFDIEVPAGTTVFDRISDIAYTYGEADDAASHLSELVLQGKAAVEDLKLARGNGQHSGSRSRAAARHPWKTTSSWLIWLNVAALVTIAMFVAYRIYRRGSR